MPKLVLSRDQAVEVQPILDFQADRKIGCLAVCNFGCDRQSHRIVGLSWSAATALCRKNEK
jgi:hypothetical protein